VSMCGHLFCWPCIHQWLETRGARTACPVCKSAINRDKVTLLLSCTSFMKNQLIPLYGRGDDWTKDPRDKVPPRPQGQRSEHEASSAWVRF
ncbi:hypothetical protein Ciccas_001365, partial [Cichlidogyrus casuarinus]